MVKIIVEANLSSPVNSSLIQPIYYNYAIYADLVQIILEAYIAYFTLILE